MAKVTFSLTLNDAMLLRSVVNESLQLAERVLTNPSLGDEYLKDPERGKPALQNLEGRYATLERIVRALD